MPNDNNIDDIIKELEEEKTIKGLNEKLRNRNKEIIKGSKKVEDIIITDGSEENCIFKPSQKFSCKLIINSKNKPEKGKLRISNKETVKNVYETKIYSKIVNKVDDDKYSVQFNWNSISLDPSYYDISIVLDDDKVIEDISIQVLESNNTDELTTGDWIVLGDPINDNEFPSGKFYVFGDIENILEKYKKGNITVPVIFNNNLISIDKLKEKYDKGKIINK